MMHLVHVFALIFAIAILSVACQNRPQAHSVEEGKQEVVSQIPNDKWPNDKLPGDEQPSKEDKAPGEKSYYYSPFVVKLGGGHFDTVSFKDVGLARESKEANDPLLEVISQSFALKVNQHEALGYDTEVTYDEQLLDPANHLSCGLNHLYIDVWQSSSPDRWGYSLWSGCGEFDNFAWKEVPATAGDEDLTQHVEPLTSHIVESLAEAAKSKCFQKTC